RRGPRVWRARTWPRARPGQSVSMRRSSLLLQYLQNRVKVLVPTPRQVDQDDRVTGERGRQPDRLGDCVRAFQRRDDAFVVAEQLERGQRLIVSSERVMRALQLAQVSVLRPDGCV